jgi:hypothetical protein
VRPLPARPLNVGPLSCGGERLVKPYDEEREIADYVWQFHRDLFTAAEKRAYGPYFWEQVKLVKKRDIVESEWKRHRIAEDAEVMALIADGVEVFHRRAAQRVVREHADKVFLNRCPRCNRVVRTPKAQQCLWCGNDWHPAAVATAG